MIEFCHNVKPFPQPHPQKNPGGDCFACSLTAVLQHLFPDNPPKFETVWDYFMTKYLNSEEKGLSNTWTGMKKAFSTARYEDGYPLEYTYDLVLPRYDWEHFSYAFYPRIPSDGDYSRRLEGWLRSGWIALTEINMYGPGPFADGRYNDTNHFIALDGTRELWEPWKSSSGEESMTLEYYIHVVCSVKGAYWIKTRELMKMYGAAGWWLVRKSQEHK
jgi:hypothetical protein